MMLDAHISYKFISDYEREAKSEREICLFIKTRQYLTVRRKAMRKKIGAPTELFC